MQLLVSEILGNIMDTIHNETILSGIRVADIFLDEFNYLDDNDAYEFKKANITEYDYIMYMIELCLDSTVDIDNHSEIIAVCQHLLYKFCGVRM